MKYPLALLMVLAALALPAGFEAETLARPASSDPLAQAEVAARSAAAKSLARACGDGAALGCSNLGWFVEWGLGGERRDPAHAAQLYQQACNAGTGIACRNLGLLAARGKGVGRDTTRAIELLRRALVLDPQIDAYEIVEP